MSVCTRALHHLSLSALAFAALTPLAHAQNLFVSDKERGSIYQITPAGVKTTFATGLNGPFGLAFDSSGNLYVTADNTGPIKKFTPAGVRTTFATGFEANFLAFAPVPAAVTPEPGSVALLIGLAVTGAGFAGKRRKPAWSAA